MLLARQAPKPHYTCLYSPFLTRKTSALPTGSSSIRVIVFSATFAELQDHAKSSSTLSAWLALLGSHVTPICLVICPSLSKLTFYRSLIMARVYMDIEAPLVTWRKSIICPCYPSLSSPSLISASAAKPGNSCRRPLSRGRHHAATNCLSDFGRTIQQSRSGGYILATALYHQSWNQISQTSPFYHLRPHSHPDYDCTSYFDSTHDHHPKGNHHNRLHHNLRDNNNVGSGTYGQRNHDGDK